MEDALPAPRLSFSIRRGDSDLALVLVHGFGCSSGDWEGLLSALGDRHTIMIVDLPGHGESPLLEGKVTIKATAQALRHAISYAGLEQVVLLGHSLGAKIVREVFHQQPGLVAGLVMIDGGAYVGDAEAICARIRSDIASEGFSSYVNRLIGQMFVSGSDPELIRGMSDRAQKLEPHSAEALLMASVRWDIVHGDDVLRLIDIPTLVLQTTCCEAGVARIALKDGQRTPFMQKIGEMVPSATIVTMTGVGHFPMIEAPEKVASILRDFLREAPCLNSVVGA